MLAQLLPKLQLVCPRIMVRAPVRRELRAEAFNQLNCTFTLNVSKLRVCVCYTTTGRGGKLGGRGCGWAAHPLLAKPAWSVGARWS